MLDQKFEGYLLRKAMEMEDEAAETRRKLMTLKAEPCCSQCVYWDWDSGEFGECASVQYHEATAPWEDYQHTTHKTRADFCCKYFDGDKK